MTAPASTWIAPHAAGSAAGHAVWLAAAAAVGFLVSFFGVSVLALPRDGFVLLHVVVSGAFVLTYWRRARLDAAEFLRNWRRGLVVAVVAGGFAVHFVLSQPSSAGPSGLDGVWRLMWLGLAYGVVDTLLLTVLPVVAVFRIAASCDAASSPIAIVVTGAAALLASAVVTAAYHLGFPEFRGAALVQPLIGNAVFTLAYLVSASPLAPILAHIALHVASVLHAFTTSVPLPPHY